MEDDVADLHLSVPETIAWTADVFIRNGCLDSNAQSVARALVGAEADGLKGHGLSRIPTYLTMLKSGKIDGKAVPSFTRTAPGVLSIDAAQGYSYPAIDLAIAELPAIARAQGIAVAPIRRSNHCGAAGLHVERLARTGMVAMFFANAPASIAPWGGRKPVFGTNPIAFAAPLADQPPVVVDLSVSKVARGNLLAAKQTGEPIPEGWALDAEGQPTTDPVRGLAGTMVPMGEAKGAALAFMVEALSACLVGATLAIDSPSFFDGEGPPPETGQLILAIDPAAFGHDRFSAGMARLASAVTGQDGTRLPGARRMAIREKTARDGIVIPADIVKAAG
jgi:(2R)-3-sulfolactate dehydrogenase (NADP+)